MIYKKERMEIVGLDLYIILDKKKLLNYNFSPITQRGVAQSG